jgi:HK97 family phage major capsid protein
MSAPTLRTGRQYLDEARALVEQPGFNRETEAKFNAIMRLFESTRASSEYGLGQLGRKVRAELAAAAIDPASLAFFRGQQTDEPMLSASGGRLERLAGARIHGKPTGAMTVLRDTSLIFGRESRTYAGLTTAMGGTDGGNTIPIGFIATVFAAMKRTDQVLEAANWDIAATEDGRPTDLPSMTDTSTSAVIVSEAGPMTFANPSAFANLQFPQATTWSSQVIKASMQLDEDAGIRLAILLGDAFRIRFARGFGAQVITYLLSDTPVEATTAGASAITQADLLSLLDGIDPAYGAADTAGWIMNWATLVYIFTNVITSNTAGDALYHAKTDGRGHFLLFGKPVFISPSLPNIGASNIPVMYGDFSRLLIRHVPSEAEVRRYDELYAFNFQVGYEMILRADPKVMHAGGAGDNPIVALQCHS